jgi:hypothetical protein
MRQQRDAVAGRVVCVPWQRCRTAGLVSRTRIGPADLGRCAQRLLHTPASHLRRQARLSGMSPSQSPAGRAASSVVDDGCRYGMIDIDRNPWPHPFLSVNPWRLCSPNVSNISHHQGGFSLGGYLVRLMMGKVGRAVPHSRWPTNLATACNWSLVVQELLSLLPHLPSHVAGSRIAAPSGMPVMATASSTRNVSFTATPTSTVGGPPLPGDLPTEDEEGAFAVILLTTRGGLDARG